MKADCHIHMLLDGVNWKAAIAGHQPRPDELLIRARLETYRALGYTYLRDGGDRWGVGAAARRLAPEFGITYRTPLAPLCLKGNYGGFIGESYADLKEYAALVRSHRAQGADFIKIMISGLMDFDRCGVLTQEGLEPGLIRELIHIAHEEGFAVMAHANGARTIQAAAEAGVDSVEHGAYADAEALAAMTEMGTVWCPTLSTAANLRGKGRFREEAVQEICETFCAALQSYCGLIAPGSDAGAWSVPHDADTEYGHLRQILGADADARLKTGAERIMEKF